MSLTASQSRRKRGRLQRHRAKPGTDRLSAIKALQSVNSDIAYDDNHGKSLIRKYGIDHAEYNAMLDRQDGKCAICKDKCKSGKRLCVDHDHATGRVRGLLCSRCNTALGSLDDDTTRLQMAIDYLSG